jgi:hypothetical protein
MGGQFATYLAQDYLFSGMKRPRIISLPHLLPKIKRRKIRNKTLLYFVCGGEAQVEHRNVYQKEIARNSRVGVERYQDLYCSVVER